MRIVPVLLLLGLAAVPALAACEDKKASDTARTDAGAAADKYATADPKLEKAIKAAASADSTEGPPPDGIFAPGAADKRHAKGAPTTYQMLSQGSDPKVSLLPGADSGADVAKAAGYGPALLEVAIAIGRGAMPTVDFQLLLGPSKDSADWLVAEVKKAQPSQQQAGQLPPGLDKEIASFEGSQFRVKTTADGRASNLVAQLGKDAKSELETIAQTATESLVLDVVPLPSQPVGVGAQWIAETRMPLQGVDTVTYRAYRVTGIDGDRVHLSLDVKAYAASHDVQIGDIPKGSTLAQFATESQGKLDLVRGESVARTCDVQSQIVMVFAGPGGMKPPQQPGGSRATSSRSSCRLRRRSCAATICGRWRPRAVVPPARAQEPGPTPDRSREAPQRTLGHARLGASWPAREPLEKKPRGRGKGTMPGRAHLT